MSILCSMVGASFTVAAAAEVIRKKTSILPAGSTVSTTQSKFGGSSATFNGSSQYINVPHQTQLDISAYSNWTIECWSRLTDGTSRTILNKDGITGSAYPGYTFFTNGSKQVIFGVGGSAGNWITVTRSTALADNTWYHLAAVKSGSTVTFYVDGTSAGTATFVGYTDQSRPLYIGWEANGTYMYGYIDEVRISNTARYTANFTPSTTAFVNDANTVFLMHANGTNASTFFEDDNGVRASRSLIAQGNAQIDTAQSQFGGSALLCDGTGDYVMSPAGTHWDFGTGSFTIEFWIRFNVAPTLYVPIALRPSGSINNGEWWCEITNAEKKMYWGFKNFAGTQFYVNLALAGTAFATGQWYHIALVNNAGTAQMYVNGTATGTTTALSGSFGISTSDLWVGAGAGSYSLNGWMDEVRISNTARYTTGFTPSTTPFVNDSNTLLLMHMDGTDATTVFRDDNGARTPKGIAAIGNAQINTAQSKFGGSSYLGDGTGDRLNVIGEVLDSQYTVEYWFRAASFSNSPTLVDFRGGGGGAANYSDYITSGGVFTVFVNNGNRIQSSALSTNTWYHIAVVRESNSDIKLYVNGTKTGDTYNYSGYHSNTTWYIGDNYVFSNSFNGHIDELRVSNTARYTANFTAPTAPFQNDANTVLLLHIDGTDGSTVFTDDNGIAPYTP